MPRRSPLSSFFPLTQLDLATHIGAAPPSPSLSHTHTDGFHRGKLQDTM